VEWRDWDAILLDVDAMLQGIWGTDLSDLVLRGHVCDCCVWRVVDCSRRRTRKMTSYLIEAGGRNFGVVGRLRQCGRRTDALEQPQTDLTGDWFGYGITD
jgi:hypothetical protein